jgi:hypothetical protein
LLDTGGRAQRLELARKRTRDHARQQDRIGTALLNVAVAVSRVASLDALMEVIAAEAAEAVGANRAEVQAYDPTHQFSVASGLYGFSYDESVIEQVNQSPPSMIPAEVEIARTKQPLHRDIRSPFRKQFSLKAWFADIVVPLIAEDAVEGVLYVWTHGAARRFTPDEAKLLTTIGLQAGSAIVHVRDRQVADRRADHLALLNQVGRALSGTVELEELCAAIHAEVSRALASDAFYIALYESGQDHYDLVYLVDGGIRYPGYPYPL